MIIDELSMISKNIFAKVEFVCRNIRGNDFVFGGIQLVGSGNFFPVVSSSKFVVWRFRESCLDSDIFLKTFPHKVTLNEIIRQDELDLINAVSDLEKGTITEESKNLLENLRRPLPSSQNPVYLYARNFYVNLHNHDVLSKMDGEFSFYESRDTGNKQYLNKMTVQEKLALKNNCRVILLKNLDKNLLNAMMGNIIISLLQEKIS